MIMYQLLINNKWGYGLKDARVSVLGLERRDGYEDINRYLAQNFFIDSPSILLLSWCACGVLVCFVYYLCFVFGFGVR